MTKHLLWLIGAFILISQQTFANILGLHLGTGWEALIPGLAIIGAAFILSWAAELAQMEISQNLALACLALVAVLPEYAVDIYFAWTAGKDPSYISYATANMTGANRLLIGLGWPVVLFAFWFKTRKKHIQLEPHHGIELSALLMATLYSFFIPIKQNLSLIDSIVFLAIFIFYMISSARAHHIKPEIKGPAELFAKGSKPYRWIITIAFFLLSGYTIYISAEPFAEGLLKTGRTWGIEEFIVVQWLAPLASESPEFIVAIIFALKANAGAGLGTLISSKVNQWTLLIACLPVAFAISGGHIHPMGLDKRQVEEIFLTSAQSLFAIFILSNFRFSLLEALILIILFSTQLFFTSTEVRLGYAGGYIILALFILVLAKNRRQSIFLLIRKKGRDR